jgi:error-prone DNA polymerase
MGFYSSAQLIQDAQRHHIVILPVDINQSIYDNNLELHNHRWAIRMGFCEVKSLDNNKAASIENWRGDKPFASLQDVADRTGLTAVDLQCLASADVLRSLSGNRYQSRWLAAGIEHSSPLLNASTNSSADDLFTAPPTTAMDVLNDYQTLGYTLREHPMLLLRGEEPFKRCTKQSELIHLRHKGFVRVAGLVTCHQRPGTAKGTMFLTLEDETGNMNVVVWKGTQETYRKILLTAQLLLIKGTVEIATEHVTQPVVHIIAGQLHDYTDRLQGLLVKSRDFR